MESEDNVEETNAAWEEQAAYGAHQEYGPDGHYDDPYYAMSATAKYNHSDGYPNEDADKETYAS